VNEPLTTARFSGLYGHWYPHARDQQTFLRCLINQCRGVVFAMRAIREVNPAAALIQTDDLGKTYSTQAVSFQAEYENERRWVTWDFLTGTLRRDSWMWRDFIDAGISERELAAFQEAPCPPDIIGINHYITSDRFLDDNLSAHPPETHGGNGRQRYADVAAVRVRPEGIAGTEGVLREAWERYRLPLAVTEAHIGCTREEQLRWFMDVWRGAEKLCSEGADVRAVTVWSLLGAHDWNSLLTRQDGFYEPGAYDLRGGALRPTAIAKMVHELAGARRFDHPTLETPGWWRRSVRILLRPSVRDDLSGVEHNECFPTTPLPVPPRRDRLAGRPILITGANGRLAQGFIRAAELRGLSYRLVSHAQLDIADAKAVSAIVQLFDPWALVNCAGYARVDDAENEEQICIRANTHGAATLASVCARTGTRLVTFSSDHVFDGGGREPYVESDDASPLNVYGESKLLGELQVLSSGCDALVIRPGKVFAPFDERDFLRQGLRAIARGEQVRAANDIRVSGTYLPDLVHATLDLLVDGETGVWHLANSAAVTPEQLLRTAAEIAQLDAKLIEGVSCWKLNRPALRPRNRALASVRGQLLPPLEDALQRYWNDAPPIGRRTVEFAATS
jgi:dTDP-4-dehydrorhamnose reductase